MDKVNNYNRTRFESDDIPNKISGRRLRGMFYGWNACMCRYCATRYSWNVKSWKEYRKTQYRVI